MRIVSAASIAIEALEPDLTKQVGHPGECGFPILGGQWLGHRPEMRQGSVRGAPKALGELSEILG